ncbi:MAG TPA: MBL fold metallo-hydrolase [Xanthobacteraceae bacterium]|nr:MBL fold metallo-hydrolase [Xanthobacteraceae bacterium]
MQMKSVLKAAICLAVLLVPAGHNQAAAQARTTLDIYVVDVEGGNATLFIAPSGESVLIDTGNFAPEAAVRDAERIAAAAKDARLIEIDHLITTHWHGDHFGGMAEVAKRIPIRDYIDHGPNIQPVAAFDEFFAKIYPALYGAAKHTVAKPGDTIAVAGLDWRIVTAAGAVLKAPLAGAGAVNASCANFKPQNADTTENAQSVGSVITFGKFRAVHLGDLTWNKEFELMCPNNPIGAIDLFVVSHHGLGVSNSPVLVHGIRPRVAVVNNGTRKGAVPDSMKTLFSSPGIEDVWQIHFSQLSGQEYTVPGMLIANDLDAPLTAMPIQPIAAPPTGPDTPPPPAHNGPAYWIKVSAQPDGTFTVTNARNGFAKTYGTNGRGTN